MAEKCVKTLEQTIFKMIEYVIIILWLRKQVPQRYFLFLVLLILLSVVGTTYAYNVWCIGNNDLCW
jgi:hypothetical protein